MSEIQSLTSQIQQLERSAGFWNSTYLVLVLVTLICGVLMFVAQLVASRRSTSLRDAETRLFGLQDRQREQDIVHARERTEELARENSQLQLEVEKEKAARLKLESYASWRTITDEQERTIVEHLMPLKGHTLNMFVFTTDPEVVAFADRIADVFAKVMKVTYSSYPGKLNPKSGLRFSVGVERDHDFEIIAHALGVAGVEKAGRCRPPLSE